MYLFMGHKDPPMSQWLQLSVREFFEWTADAAKLFENSME
jgi:hypothetical protein